MNCDRVERWLNEGLPVRGSGRAHAHAARCPICAGRIVEARALDAFLAFASPPAAAAHFADSVMARIVTERPVLTTQHAPAHAAPTPARWLAILTDPAVTISVASVSVLLGLWRVLRVVARVFPGIPVAAALGSLHLSSPRISLPLSPLGEWMLLLGVVPLVVWGCLLLSRWAEQVVRTPR